MASRRSGALLVVAASVVCLSVFAGRTVTSLSGPGWICDGEAVSVPHCWNGIDGADGSPSRSERSPSHCCSVSCRGSDRSATEESLDRYGMSISPDTYLRKAAVYTRALPDPTAGRRQFIRFGAVSREATVKINGRLAGTHAGAFTAFTVEATDFLKPTGNVLEVIADNRYNPELAPLSADYTLMGGIYRDVEWLETPEVCIDPVTDGVDGVVLDINTNGTVVATVRVSRIVRALADVNKDAEDSSLARGGASDTVVQVFHFPDPELWTPENPKLYSVHVEIESGDAIDIPFGFRTVEFRADGFYLNGRKRKLRGVNRHQDVGARGWAATAAEDERDFALIKEVGADAVRLAHYPQSRRVMDLCDRLGLLVWCEEPAINWLSKSPAFKTNLLQQAREMIAQNRNHPCIFAWSLFNEIYNSVPPDREEEGWMEAILAEARDQMKRQDPSRPVVAASDRPAKRALNDLPDQLAFNAYPGWYGDTTMREDIDNWFASSGRKLMGIAEYGAGGNPFEHLDPLPPGRLDPGGPLHPEETQVKLHMANWREICAEPRLWGTFIWAMFDFAADARREGGKNGVNDKGLVTRDRAVKKDAFYFYKANWSSEPVLHLCSQRATETTNATCTVVGFSNVGPVTLFVNGRARTPASPQTPDAVHVIRWENIPLAPGENVIELTADGLQSVRRIRRTRALTVCAITPLSRGASTGIESDPAQTGTGGQTVRANSLPHLKATMWELRDRTDGVGELVQTREWLLMRGTGDVELTGNVVDVQDVVTGAGTVYLRLAPLPGSRNWEGPDFRLKPGSQKGIEVIERDCRTLTIPYTGGEIGRRTALMKAQRELRPFVPGRDGLFLSNTWGDRNRDARLCEPFMAQEIEAAAKLGVDVVQVDDGWQKGRTANSAAANGKGVWDGYWATDPDFWKADPVRFPHGLKGLADAVAAKGVGLGLWFGPDSSNDAANWERDADLLLDYHRTYGINYFKIDSLKTRSPKSLEHQSALFEKVLRESKNRVVFDLDVTAERRPGYLGLPEIGPVFVENRYSDWGKYWPHQTLRQFWSLADVIDPVRLRMEILNPLRNQDKYANDPLAPAKWPIESTFATIMLGSPLGWFEASGLAPETMARLAPFVATWKQHRDRLHAGVVHPIGAKPDGVSWTGFIVVGEKTLDLVLFRELNANASHSLDLNSYLPLVLGQPLPACLLDLPCEVLSPRGKAVCGTNGHLTVTVDDPLDFVWVKITP